MNEDDSSGFVATTVVLKNKLGMHARAAALFVKAASKYRAEIKVARDDQKVNGKSIMGILTLAAPQGTPLTIWANGDDADQALEELSCLIERRFGEE
ncbi:MAG: HPr family phosphocarrier protein [Thermodesulfobacteriota bacterium]